ncbi:MAG: hypothetical protein V7767_10380, partial [Leeuwenhoekiella sp.]
EIIESNKTGKAVNSLEEYAAELISDTKIDFGNVVGQDSLTRFDTPKPRRKKRKTRSKNAGKTHNKGSK